MNFEFRHLLPEGFAPESRVWLYQASRRFMMSEALEAEEILHQFVAGWKSHGAPVKGFATILFGQFVLIMADETHTGVGGCSTDSSVRVVKQLEQQFQIPLFDRTQLAFIVKDKVELLPLAQFQYAAENGFINAHTIYCNNTVLTKAELETNWLIPVKDSWLAKKMPQPAQ